MGEKFYMDLEAFQAKYQTREMREQVLRKQEVGVGFLPSCR